MSKHTPGPWTFEAGDHGNCGMIVGKTGVVCDFVDDPKEANARLIAAAPELLAALEMSLKEMEKDWMRLDGEFGPYMQEFGDIEGAIRKKHRTTKTICMVIAAITKATGEVK